jgi:DNA-binding IclR family transcriptional regulator
VILAQEESPDKIRLSVEVGGSFSPLCTVSGRLLLSMLNEPELGSALQLIDEYRSWSKTSKRALQSKLRNIRARGHAEAYSETVRGVYDLSVPVGGGPVQAALTIACLSHDVSRTRRRLLPALKRCSLEIGRIAGLSAASPQYDSTLS